MANISDSWEVELTLKYDDGTPVDFTAVENAIFAVYHEPGLILEKFSITAKTGFTTLPAESLTNGDTGVVSLFMDPEKTGKATNKKKLFAEVRISLNNDAFPDGVQVVTATDIVLEPAGSIALEGEEP